METQIWTDKFLDEQRLVSDKVADKAAKSIFGNKSSSEIFKELRKMATNNAQIPDAFPVDLRKYFTADDLIFTDAEKKKLDIAAKVFRKYGAQICAILYLKSLPTGYMCPYPAHVLKTTHILIDQTTRRIIETAMFLFRVSSEKWNLPEGSGLMAIKKVRLMHAGMRLAIQTNPDHSWKTESLGIPINQEDLTLTLQLFYLAVFDGLHRMGIVLTEEEKEAYFFKWTIIGRLLGIETYMEPNSLESSYRLYHKILSRLVEMPSPDGPILATALIDMVLKYMPSKITKSTFEKMILFFISNPKCYKTLGFAKPSIWERIFDFLVSVLLNMKNWASFYPDSSSLKNKPNFIQRKTRTLALKRFGIKDTDKVGSVNNWTEVLSKFIVDALVSKAKLSDGSNFVIEESMYEDLGLNELHILAADSYVSVDYNN